MTTEMLTGWAARQEGQETEPEEDAAVRLYGEEPESGTRPLGDPENEEPVSLPDRPPLVNLQGADVTGMDEDG